MNKMQVVTLRMTEEEIDQLEKLTKHFYYYKRSDIIRAACQFLTSQVTPGAQANIIAGYGRRWKGYKFTVNKEDLVNGTQRYSEQQSPKHQEGEQLEG